MAVLGAVTLLVAGANVAVSSEAQASPLYQSNLDGWCDEGEICLYYNSNVAGSVFDVNYDVSNYAFNIEGQPGGAEFVCSAQAHGDGPLCSGVGQHVWNNAASVLNESGCDVAIYYNSGFNGSYAYQVITRGGWANLNSKLKNQNASHRFLC
ncbi:peptidase inhibitor family I36 protein [Kitasatospora sp. NPDC058170]|uniref:peptidase inhibitor family I36 protein n=1 Tax=Kitasatospora sp. NPDC058170 TaxID=3346364 RepID=UPI0036DAF766